MLPLAAPPDCSGSSRCRSLAETPAVCRRHIPSPSIASVRRCACAVRDDEPRRRGREYFVSWGYNGDSYTKSDMHFSQPSLGNDFTLVERAGPRQQAVDETSSSHGLFVPQYNVRFGVFFNEKWGLELALDHIKWIVKEDQEVRMTGTLNGAAVDTARHADAGCPALPAQQRREPYLRQPDQALCSSGASPGARATSPSWRRRAAGSRPAHREHAFGQPNDKGLSVLPGLERGRRPPPSACTFSSGCTSSSKRSSCTRATSASTSISGTARHSVKANEFTLNLGLAFR